MSAGCEAWWRLPEEGLQGERTGFCNFRVACGAGTEVKKGQGVAGAQLQAKACRSRRHGCYRRLFRQIGRPKTETGFCARSPDLAIRIQHSLLAAKYISEQ